MRILRFAVGSLLMCLSLSLFAEEAPADAAAYIIQPVDGAKVSSPVKVVFGLKGMGVAPAGVDKNHTGHHHLLIDTTLEDYTKSIPKDKKHMHFGGGQTETTLELPKGKHTLQLVLGDKAHVPHQPPVLSETITITVE